MTQAEEKELEKLRTQVKILTAENEILRKETSKGRPLSDSIPNYFYNSFPIAMKKINNTETYYILKAIRESCFPKSKRYTARAGFHGQNRKPSIVRVHEMDDNEYKKYVSIAEQIFDILNHNAFVEEGD
jgi:hypothetical protein